MEDTCSGKNELVLSNESAGGDQEYVALPEVF